MRKVSPVSYEIDVADRKKRKRQMLKAWRTPDGQVLKALGADMDENDMEGDGGTLMSAVQLMEGQKKQLDELLQEKTEVLVICQEEWRY